MKKLVHFASFATTMLAAVAAVVLTTAGIVFMNPWCILISFGITLTAIFTGYMSDQLEMED